METEIARNPDSSRVVNLPDANRKHLADLEREAGGKRWATHNIPPANFTSHRPSYGASASMINTSISASGTLTMGRGK